MVQIEYDPAKNDRNEQERGISFHEMNAFDWSTALIWEDDRRDYGESRFSGLGHIHDALHAVVFTMREDIIRIISLRRANMREQRKYYREISHEENA